MYAPTNGVRTEWIELVNRSTVTADLGNCPLTTKTTPLGQETVRHSAGSRSNSGGVQQRFRVGDRYDF